MMIKNALAGLGVADLAAADFRHRLHYRTGKSSTLPDH